MYIFMYYVRFHKNIQITVKKTIFNTEKSSSLILYFSESFLYYFIGFADPIVENYSLVESLSSLNFQYIICLR